ncbi:MAG: PKD domain-containing protein [Gemmatimonadaceae bacterium]
MSRLFVGAFLLVGVIACSTKPLEPLPLEITIAANRTTAAPGDTITFVTDAQGGSLVGVEIDYGDTATDAFATGGARTARVTFRHAFQQRANYTVRVVVTDALAGQKEASVEVRVGS